MLFENVKRLAKKQGKSLKVVAKDLGFSENAFYKWKTQSPKAETLQQVADYFNVSVDYLLGRTDNPHLNNEVPKEAVTIAAHIDDDATEEDMKKILEYIDFIQQKYK